MEAAVCSSAGPGPFSPDTDVAVLQEYAARDREAALAVAPVALRVYRRRGREALERGAFRRFGERVGLSAAHVMRLVHLGMALERFGGLDDLVRDGRVPVEAGGTMGEVVKESGVLREGDRWLEWAQTMSTQELRSLYLRRRDEARSGEAVYTVVGHLNPVEKDDLDRCRVLVSRSGKQVASIGRTMGVLASDWRRLHDPLLRPEGKRRVPPTRGVPGRYVPRDVDRQVRARSGDRCQGPFCDNAIWLQRSHRRAHAKGGDREADNLDLLCDACHKQYEAGLFRITGEPGSPVFLTPDGRPLHRRIPYRAGRDPEAARRLDEALANAARRRPEGTRQGAPPRRRRARSTDRDHAPPAAPDSSS